jgi:hypothetical protein
MELPNLQLEVFDDIWIQWALLTGINDWLLYRADLIVVEAVENCFRLHFVCPGSNGHMNGTKDVNLLRVGDIIL